MPALIPSLRGALELGEADENREDQSAVGGGLPTGSASTYSFAICASDWPWGRSGSKVAGPIEP
ncbi:hypothetical protein [Candidatus Phycosocius spiralis]|uniref:hypothetical protein n=1 Tax=Candidatus Phycosocius spiralis TaxID=2815099 RepID=UPI0024E14678|nr:hypothetical protein [Candidatus Phycosocius spiralis]